MRTWFTRAARSRRGKGRLPSRRPAARPGLELLERREVLSTAFLETNLVSDVAGLAQTTDRALVNPWGLASGPGGPLWVANNNSGTSTIYNGLGVPQTPLLPVTIPPPAGSPAGTLASPTGTVFNGNGGFNVTENGVTGPSVFLFVTEDGGIAGWAPGVDFKHAVLAVDNFQGGAGPVYKGATLGTDPDGRQLLYVANFRAGTIDVFDDQFRPTGIGGDFSDPSIPAGFAPFNVQNINGLLYVTYAQQDDAKHDPVNGAGNGFVDVFDTNGNLVQQLAAGGPLNSPWGVALAPDSFGDFGGDVLVGNFGDGHINAYDAQGNFQGQLADGLGNPITVGGLWGLRFGNDGQAGDSNTLFFSAGINHEQDGLLGTIQVGSPITPDQGNGANAFLQTNLTSDLAGIAQNTDPNLRNPWGLAIGPNTAFWASDNRTNVATLYDGQGVAQPANNPLVVNIPAVNGAANSRPTGVVFDGTGAFNVTEDGKTGSSAFIFATQQGTIVGWSPKVDRNNAVIAVDNSGSGANYTGLALVTDQGPAELFAANSKGGIDVFDSNFQPVTLKAGAFADATLPAGYTPYNVAEVNGQLFVTFSKGPASQPGDGFIDVFQTDGTFVERFTSGGPLEEPWGMVVAPATFGKFGGDLLVGNVGNGHIDAYDLTTQAYVGTLLDGRGNPIAVNGLWGLAFGTGNAGTDPNTLYFNAGIGGYQHGLFGSLQAIEPIDVAGGGNQAVPADVAQQVVGAADRAAADLGGALFLGGVDPTLADQLIQDAQTSLHTVELQVAPLSTPLTALITQAEADLKTLVTDLNDPSNLATDVRHFAADLETLDSVFADVAANANL